ncbi:MAG: wax ester/triacylglycerol synthase family O-acyltransferase [Pseudomonadota bacterium]
MEQLTGLDTLFLHGELRHTPMHIGPLFIYDTSDVAARSITFDDILATFEARLDRSTVFRRKLVNVPLNLDHPYWIEDGSFDLRFHVRHTALPKPGDWQQLCTLVARLHAQPLDRDRPLWEAYFIEGLDNVEGVPSGAFVLFLKIHHAAIDGASGTRIMAALHDIAPQPAKALNADDWNPETQPSATTLLKSAIRNNLRSPVKMAKAAGKGLPGLLRSRQTEDPDEARDVPAIARTRFSGPIGASRAFGAVTLNFEYIRAIKSRAEGATVNDTMLSIVGGALRRYLLAKDEYSDTSLVTGAPVDVRTGGEDEPAGNVVSVMKIPLRTDIERPTERLRAIHADSVKAKANHDAFGSTVMAEIGNAIPSQVSSLGIRAAEVSGLLAGSRPLFNTIVSNLPGPQQTHYLAGAKLVRSYGAGPCWDNMGLFQVVNSYDGRVTISFQACRDMMPDPEFYEICLQESFNEHASQLGASKKKRRRVAANKQTKNAA